ncbi:MAG: acetyl/propionyl/methylcrotonyl-CoA carboxylase subunit alpha [Gemmatimonadota bacterium]
MFRKLLVANRGEIALRVIRTARSLGVRSVAVFSEADADAPHVWLADEAVRIGPATPAESYLHAEAILAAARRTGAEAVHPGYGFLSENPAFAGAVEAAGLVFVGPSADTLEAVGDKTAARARMARAGVPVVPGSDGPVEGASEALRVADEVGWPVLLKPAGGGGGKGMRLVGDARALERELAAAAREAEKAFGDPRVYVERHLGRVRHVEVQILGTSDGVRTLGERECSLQRRHQKLVEESPSPAVGPELRVRLLDAALRAAGAVGYRNAGTVEFLLDEREGLHFIEVNARLQVEHPVTEMVTGLDLVEAQLRIAAGETLAPAYACPEPEGWAIECRLCAEDPARDFLPATGTVRRLRLPGGPGVRWDGGVVEGTRVTPHYDSLLGKVITRGHDGSDALGRMAAALAELRIEGVTTNLGFLRRLLEDDVFRRGALHTGFVAERRGALNAQEPADRERLAAAAVLELERRASAAAPAANGESPSRPSAWRAERRPFVWMG